MQLLKSFLLGISLTKIVVSALPCVSCFSEKEIVGRNSYEELFQRNKLFKDMTYSEKKEAIKFVKNIPVGKDSPLTKLGNQAHTLYSADDKGRVASKGERQTSGYRLDMQGMVGKHRNIQVQLNGDPGKDKSSVGGLLVHVNGKWGPKRIKKDLVHSIMHQKDRHGNQVIRKLDPKVVNQKANPKAKHGRKSRKGKH